jgi:protein disulfide-isomerase
MKKLLLLMILILPLVAADVLKTGAVKGKWTQDYDAALKLAKDNNMPLLLNFTGSDWCKWCILMDEQVFTKSGWSAWAKNNVVLVFLDFPRDPTLVPAEYQTRNRQIQGQFGVQGYPTYVLLDSDGATELGRLSAGKGKTLDSFIGEVKGVLKYSQSNLAKLTAALTDAQKQEYKTKFAELRKEEKAMNAWLGTRPQQTPENLAIYEQYQTQIKTLQSDIRMLEEANVVLQLKGDTLQKYRILTAQRRAKEAELDAWLSTNPQKNEANTKKYQDLQTNLSNLAVQITEIEDTIY